jgi:hypothetical protein
LVSSEIARESRAGERGDFGPSFMWLKPPKKNTPAQKNPKAINTITDSASQITECLPSIAK